MAGGVAAAPISHLRGYSLSCGLPKASYEPQTLPLDSSRLKPIQTTFVQRDYRHVESDVVLWPTVCS
jgi:hypothetical protein